jgi:hypothetical protein
MPSESQARITINKQLEQAVRSLLPRFEAKIQRVLDRVWGNGIELSEPKG